ncbi:murein L,D-transpeptidase catalytic domain family protein [Bdellovibrio reynosensis]|uniref:Murein L,D-transpeptidase catalytic domain family protein n=1 Tax=Bdellovibrio reynosensis TaxID=2835041 RepID=A0ABY4CBE1_9BACT|nr:murein L,D-transpeptidase catalytic domain family protein [Bdellovibrio reynosensis]UOF02163.1 murein L,D-transpeptidase catalytic domain family protein [Bdellovibrio reynosensis]
MKNIFVLTVLLLLAVQGLAAEKESAKEVDKQTLFQRYADQGVPLDALRRTFEFLEKNAEASFKVKLHDETTKKTILNKNYAVIINYNQPSSERRLYLLNLKTGEINKYFVAHAINTGGNVAKYFSNTVDSKKSSLGFYITGSSFPGKHGNTLYLHGLEKTNDNAYVRDIVMHGASYVSLDFLESNGRLGRSWGCPAVSEAIAEKVIPLIKNGALYYIHHNSLMTVAETGAPIEDMGCDQQDASCNGNDVVAEEVLQEMGRHQSASDQTNP